MAFPWINEVNFEDGTDGTFDSETDTDSKLDFPHYSDLARVPGLAMPYRGAYCMRVDLSKGTNDAFVQEDDNIAASGTQYYRFMLWLDPNLTMADSDNFVILQLEATATVEAVCGIQYTDANGFRIGIGETAPTTSLLPISLGDWHAVEFYVTIDSGGGNDGTIDMVLDGSAATQVASLDQGAITDWKLGTIGIDAGTTKGHILFDELITDDAQIYPPAYRFDLERLLTKDSHVFVGPGRIDNVSLLSGNSTDNVLKVYDTDVANTNDASNLVAELKNTAANELVDPAGMPANVTRGCYITMTGTDPRALVQACQISAWGSDGRIRQFGLHRKQRPRGV